MSAADSVRTAVWASAELSVVPVAHTGVWSLVSVMVTVMVRSDGACEAASTTWTMMTQVLESPLAPQ